VGERVGNRQEGRKAKCSLKGRRLTGAPEHAVLMRTFPHHPEPKSGRIGPASLPLRGKPFEEKESGKGIKRIITEKIIKSQRCPRG